MRSKTSDRKLEHMQQQQKVECYKKYNSLNIKLIVSVFSSTVHIRIL